MSSIALRPAALAWGLATAVGGSAACAAPPGPAELEALAAEVTAAETEFARSLAERRLDHFAAFVAEDAVFRGAQLRVGRADVVAHWSAFFTAPAAPFSWAPDAVTVAADGRSAVSSGPVHDAAGHLVSRFVSLWRKEADGRWRVAADEGVPVPVPACEAASAAR